MLDKNEGIVCFYRYISAAEFILNIVLGGFRPSSGRGGSSGGGRSQGWVDYDYDYEAAGIERRGNNNRVSPKQTAAGLFSSTSSFR